MKPGGISLREYAGIGDGPTEELSFSANLLTCLAAKDLATADSDERAAAHAARGAAECYRRLGQLARADSEYAFAAATFRRFRETSILQVFVTFVNQLKVHSFGVGVE